MGFRPLAKVSQALGRAANAKHRSPCVSKWPTSWMSGRITGAAIAHPCQPAEGSALDVGSLRRTDGATLPVNHLPALCSETMGLTPCFLIRYTLGPHVPE